MGRKNKTKLLKHGSQSLNASTVADSDARISTNESVPEFEVLSSHLRELVSASPSTTDRQREMKYMFAALENRDAELRVARKLIQRLKEGGSAEHNGDGDTSLIYNDENFSDARQSSNEEVEKTKKRNDELTEEREKLVNQLRDTEEIVNRLKDEMMILESNQEKTNNSLDESRQTSSKIINQLNVSLEAAKTRVDSLQQELNSHQSAYSDVVKELNILKEVHDEQEHLLNKNILMKNEVCNQLEQAVKDLAFSKDEVSGLLSSLENQRDERASILHQLTLDREKLESRYEKINNGVQMTKKDFDEVKKSLISMKSQNKDLQQQLVASKADVKHYRDDGDACRTYIKKLEAKLLTSETLQNASDGLQEALKQTQEDLLNAKKEVSTYESLISSLSTELQTELQKSSILDAVKKLRESYRAEQRKQVFNLAAVEAKEAAHQKLIQQNKELLEKVENAEFLQKKEVKLFGDEKEKLTEELNSSKGLIKKVIKEKENVLKKMKRLLLENSELLKHNQSIEEKLDHSVNSASNDSLISQTSTSIEALEESIVALKTSLASNEEKLGHITKQLMDKEDENLDLHRTVVAYKSTVDEKEQETIRKQKTISMMESRLSELQRSADGLQKRYDDEMAMLHEKLQLSETTIKNMQESNTQISSDSDKLKLELTAANTILQKEINQLKSAILLHEANKTELQEFVLLKENEKSKMFEECKTLEAKLENVEKELREQENSNELIKIEILQLKEALNTAEQQKNESLDQLSKISLKVEESERSQTEKESELLANNLKLQQEIDILQTQIMNQDLQIEKLSAGITASEKAREDLSKLSDQKVNDYEKSLQSEKAKSEILSKKLEEKTTESSDRMSRLKSKEDKFEKMKVEFENDSHELRQRIEQLETQVAKAVSERNTINTEVVDLKALVAEKEAKVEIMSEEKADLDLRQELLEKEIEVVNKKLEDALSPRKDKILQLENRLEVMQTASQAQCKRLEEELSSAIASLQQSSAENRELEQQISELQEKSMLVDELSASNETMNEELAKAVFLKENVAELEKQKNDIQLENAEERAGLVNELIDTKQKLTECEKLILELQTELKSRTSENIPEEDVSRAIPVQRREIDEMFPSMDPAVRQLVVLLSENRNYSYGVLGLVVYGFLVHLYILFN